jgi:hypothetical protein
MKFSVCIGQIDPYRSWEPAWSRISPSPGDSGGLILRTTTLHLPPLGIEERAQAIVTDL